MPEGANETQVIRLVLASTGHRVIEVPSGVLLLGSQAPGDRGRCRRTCIRAGACTGRLPEESGREGIDILLRRIAHLERDCDVHNRARGARGQRVDNQSGIGRRTREVVDKHPSARGAHAGTVGTARRGHGTGDSASACIGEIVRTDGSFGRFCVPVASAPPPPAAEGRDVRPRPQPVSPWRSPP